MRLTASMFHPGRGCGTTMRVSCCVPTHIGRKGCRSTASRPAAESDRDCLGMASSEFGQARAGRLERQARPHAAAVQAALLSILELLQCPEGWRAVQPFAEARPQYAQAPPQVQGQQLWQVRQVIALLSSVAALFFTFPCTVWRCILIRMHRANAGTIHSAKRERRA